MEGSGKGLKCLESLGLQRHGGGSLGKDNTNGLPQHSIPDLIQVDHIKDRR